MLLINLNFICITGAVLMVNVVLSASNNNNNNNTNTDAIRYDPNWQSLDKRPIPGWFDEAKVGIFIHWGVFSVPSYGDEWFWYRWKADKVDNFIEFMKNNYPPNWTYQDFAKQFTTEFFDPNHWADVFRSAGAKYVVLTTKHHEGYTMWPSKYSYSWNAKDVGPNRDLVGELSTAVRNKGLRFGAYHSLMEWFNPLFIEDSNNDHKTQHFVDTKIQPELRELVNNYKPDIVWSDGNGGGDPKYWKSEEFLAWLYNDSPVKDTVVVNDRWGEGSDGHHGDFYNYNDNFNPGRIMPHKWEHIMSVSKGSWGYKRNVNLWDYMQPLEILTSLAQTISCGGNFMLNIGPTKEGTITPIFEERLRGLGDWLRVNGEAVYSSQPWAHGPNDTLTKNVWYTQKDKAVYAIVLFWPNNNNEVELGSVSYSSVQSVQMLGVKDDLKYRVGGGDDGDHTIVTFPYIIPDPDPTHQALKVAYVIKINTK
ncbi:tissue alpha-L-fucosidase-like [Oppia nitens]|uniref:tissue alpha-L-fucosidase-like n=1 Tax=Oppia nitens TaxID=1686743 RepID=UPI0023D982CD|nr:tissue alpha-L-fucosidase-like [Oppia nitens]